jgi:hypothetical protein
MICDNCKQPFSVRVAGQRFCCRPCSDQWWVAERSRAIKAWRGQRAAHAQAEDFICEEMHQHGEAAE